jgi:hypothetical protein
MPIISIFGCNVVNDGQVSFAWCHCVSFMAKLCL